MAIKIQLPRLGWSMEEGKFLSWLKQDGETVKEGEPLFTLESDKAAQEVESTDGGILSIPANGPNPGETVKVGQLLGYLLAEGESAPSSTAVASAAEVLEAALPTVHAPVRAPMPSPATHGGATSAPESVATGTPTVGTATPASPRARRAARELAVDLSSLQPTGKGGRIRERDVLAASTVSSQLDDSMREMPITPMRRTIARRMVESLNSTAPVTLNCRCDATELVAFRAQLKKAGAEVVPGVTDILAKITGGALLAHPMLSARWDERRLLVPQQIHIGIAVETDDGLLVPVLRDVCISTLTALAVRSRQLFNAARTGRLGASEMQGGCFTISNLGNFGIEGFTPIINHPETAILGVGAILREAVALEDGTFTSRLQMTLSLTFDHRIVDGAPAARFLQTLRARLEEPVAWLI
jgi:pyruvate dehydrogenase E2 component (dihydrolipoamide acetyltransferase)